MNLSRREFVKKALAGVAGIAAYSSLGSIVANAESEGVSLYTPGTYSSIQKTPYASVKVSCTFTENAITDVAYEVLSSSKADYFKPFANAMQNYCKNIAASGKVSAIDGISGATFCTTALHDGVVACAAEALGIKLPEKAPVLNPQEDGFDSFNGDCAAVFSPIKLGNMTLENRVCKSGGSRPGNARMPNTQEMEICTELYGTMAENGVSLNILNGGTIGTYAILPHALEPKEGTVEEAMAKLTPMIERIHAAGGKVGYQLTYGGVSPYTSDSDINDPTKEDFDAYMEKVAVSVARAKQIGFDCVEIKGASDDALNGFLTRRRNRREDEYGCQNTENRTRLFREMIMKVKEVNGADWPVGALINVVEENDANLGDNELFLTVEESKDIAKALVEAGADWIQVRAGAVGQELNIWAPDMQHIVNNANGITGMGTMFDYSSHYEGLMDGSHSGFACFLPMVKAIKEAVDVPVGCAAYMDLRVGPDYLNDAIANGDLDLIFMNRPLNCDPTLPRKIQEGNRLEVRPCMKCLHCHDAISSGMKLTCTCRTNATSFNSLTERMPEGQDPLAAETKRSILVIGAGPAGMEAARVAAERGHSVTLCDAADKVGGLMHFARGVKGDHERFEDFFAYSEYQLQKFGVDVKLNMKMDAAKVQEMAPDAVVVAVGGARESKLSSNANISVLSPEQAFGSSKLGNTVVILGASVQAVDFAAYLVTEGKKVIMVHGGTADDIDKGQSAQFKMYIMPYLYSKGTKVWNGAEVLSLEENGLTIKTAQGFEKLLACDSVVEFYDMVPNTALADELSAAGMEVYTVGDCAQPYNIQKAITAGNLVARAL